jgi:hypothetical protein
MRKMPVLRANPRDALRAESGDVSQGGANDLKEALPGIVNSYIKSYADSTRSMVGFTVNLILTWDRS